MGSFYKNGKLYTGKVEAELTGGIAYNKTGDLLKISNKEPYKVSPIVGDFKRLPDTQMRPMETDKDGTIYGYHIVTNLRLASSTDGGVTALEGYQFAEPIVGVRVSGTHIIVATWGGTGTPGEIYVGDKANGINGPFTLKITMSTDVYPADFGFYSYYDAPFDEANQNKNIVLINEYGNKTPPDVARRTYLSTDGGETFNIIWEGDDVDDTHMHAAVYDPYASRIWISVGDEPDIENGSIFFSEDMGDTWTRAYPLGEDADLINATVIVPTPKYVLFCTDKTPITGVYRWSRERELQETINGGDISNALELSHVVRYQKVGEQPHYSRGFLKVSDLEYYISFGTGSTDPRTPYILATGDGGETIHTIYMDLIPTGSNTSFIGFNASPCGPTTSNEIVCNYVVPDGNGSLIFTKPEWK